MFEPYCPECGAVEITEIKGIHFDGSHMHCEKCYQEFFNDVDYSRAIGFNLRKMKEEIERQRAVIAELADLVEQETARVKQKHDLIERADEIISMSLPMTERYGGRQWLKDVKQIGAGDV